MKLHHLLSPFSVIASVRSKEEMEVAIQNQVKHVFLVRCTISEIADYAKMAENNNMHLYVYFDMIRGFSKDKEAVIYLNQQVKMSGLVSNKAHIVNEAMQAGLYGIFTLFLLDSHSLRLGRTLLKDLQPDAVNIAPGNLPSTIEDLVQDIDLPIIASGLITKSSEVRALYHAGCSAISTSKVTLWSMDSERLEEGIDHDFKA